MRVCVRGLLGWGSVGAALVFPFLAPAARATPGGPPGDVKAGSELAKTRCALCHSAPAPDVLPRGMWANEIAKMVLMREGKTIPVWGRPPGPVELEEDDLKILAFYEARAPIAFPPLEAWPAPDDKPLRFEKKTLAFPGAVTPEPAVSNVRLVDGPDGRMEVLATDMRQGVVLRAIPSDPTRPLELLASIPHPDHIATADLDGDGLQDLLVADLGRFYPGDHLEGAVDWLRGRPGGGYTLQRLGNFPRVADVEEADFDGDGRLDLVVAAFGYRLEGEIDVLLNRTADWARPVFERHTVDRRAGAIHVVPTDLNGDGKTDFVALLAQEHEEVVAYLGDGAGGFASHRLYQAPHPNWGSTGLQLVDFDGDGDFDVLVTNGDMFDDDVLKPYHGIQWLENKGGLRFEPHHLARLAGVHRAVAVDLDGDGDLDVVAAVLTAGVAPDVAASLPSLVWLERVAANRFVKHTLEVGHPVHATLDVEDVNADGRPDVVTGVFVSGGTSDHWLEVWANEGPELLAKGRHGAHPVPVD